MSEPHRALAFLLVIGAIAWVLMGRLRQEQLPGAFNLRRALWFVLTIAAFGLADFWLFSVVALVVLVWARTRDPNAPALFFSLLFVVPAVALDIPGLGLINFLFSLSFPRLLALVLLLPLFLQLVRRPRAPSGALPKLADLMFFAYLGVQVLLLAREPSVTSAFRSAFYLFVDLLLPYYVFSRAFVDMDKVRDAVVALVTGGVVLAAVGMFEVARYWLPYAALTQAWQSPEQLMYLDRSGLLRALASAGHAIVLGYVLAICFVLFLPVRTRLARGWQRHAILLVLAAGLFAALSRGPWVGAAVGVLAYLVLGATPMKSLLKLGVGSAMAFAVLAMLPFGRFVVDLLPFVGTVETGNIDYREQLMENAWKIIWRNPVLGSIDYTERLAAMGMVQGQGIVDIVNTYVQVALHSGLTGLVLFAGVQAAALFSVVQAQRLARRSGRDEAQSLGRGLAAAQLAVIVIIVTVSSIFVIPWLYWCLSGLLVGYARVVHASVRAARTAPAAASFA
jgi:hypothetical protein